jgi:hypothetical protein
VPEASVIMKKRLSSIILFAAILGAGAYTGFRIVHVPDQFVFVTILALFMFYPILRFPLVGVYLLFIIMPVVPFIRRLYYLAYARPAADPLIIIGDIIVSMMVLGLFFVLREQLQQGILRNRIIYLVFFYFVYMVLRTFVANELPLGTALLKFRFYGPQVLLFFIGVLYAGRETHLKRLWALTVVIAIGAVLYGLKQSLFGYSEAEKIWFSSIDFTSLFIKGIARPFSFFQSPAAFADYLQLAIIGLIFFTGCGKAAGKILWVLVPLLWTGVLITSVRSSWIGMALTFFIWLLIVRVRSLTQRIVIIALIAASFMTFDVLGAVINTGLGIGSIVSSVSGTSQADRTINLLITERANALDNPFQEHSIVSRIALWKYIIEMSTIPQLALLGRGIGVLSADSLYITYLAELGYPGVLLIIALLVFFIRYGFKVIDAGRSKWTVSLAVAVVTMDIVMAVIGITGSHIHAFPGDTYFWFWNGVVVGLWTGKMNHDEWEEAYETAPDA